MIKKKIIWKIKIEALNRKQITPIYKREKDGKKIKIKRTQIFIWRVKIKRKITKKKQLRIKLKTITHNKPRLKVKLKKKNLYKRVK